MHQKAVVCGRNMAEGRKGARGGVVGLHLTWVPHAGGFCLLTGSWPPLGAGGCLQEEFLKAGWIEEPVDQP